jgi:eukaryotic-like serine/threonine-protein kinase
MPLPAGTLLNNRYRIVSILGQGGMGAVYRANDENVGIPVAVKENLFLTDEYTRQFQREARILASMRHPGLPHVTDYFIIEGQGQYLVMDYIEGEDLRQRMERTGPLAEREAILIGISVLDALEHLHTRQPAIIHRDIKPGNIKVTPEGMAVLVDFGLAKVLQPGQATQTGARAMTPGYSPPEQYGTSRTDARSDIYSLGATLYATLTGTIPEDGLNRMAGKSELTDIRELRPKINRRLAEIIEHAMEVEPDDRFQSADEYRQVLIECGEMAAYFRERPTLTPPPAEPPSGGNGDHSSFEDRSGNLKRISRPSGRVRRARRQAALRFIITLLLVLTVVVIALAVAFQPNLPGSVLAYFSSSPTQGASQAAPPTDSPTLAPSATQTMAQEPLPSDGTPTITVTETRTPAPTLEPQETIPPSPSPTPIGGTGEIAFASERTGVMQIWVVDVATKQLRQITNKRDGACQPSWSPDGLRMAFISPCQAKKEQYQGTGIYLINVDGSGETPLPSSPEGDFDPAWSPDGKHIAFTSLRNGKAAIYIMDLDTQAVNELSLSQYPDFQPSWSPTSRQLTFVRKLVFNQIWIMSEDGSLQSQFSVSGNANNFSPSWSRDGNVIFFSQSANDTSIPSLVGMRYEDRKTPREFRIPAGTTNDIGPVVGAVMSPDGFWMVYEGWPNGKNHDIYIMTANGASITRLTTDPGLDFGPVWRPDSNQP